MKHSIIIIIITFLTSLLFTSNAQNQNGQDVYGEYSGDGIGGNNRIALSSDGNFIAIGSPSNSDGALLAGHIRIFENQSSVWTQIGTDIDGDFDFVALGGEIDLSSDGSIVAGSTSGNDGISGNRGGIRVYQNQSGVWTQLGTEIYGRAGGTKIDALSLSTNGNIVAFGDKGHTVNNPESYVGVYKYESNDWVLIGDYIDAEDTFDLSGASISLSSDGNRIAIGAPNNDGNSIDNDNFGHVRIFENQSEVWTQLGSDIDGKSIGNQIGFSVSLSSDGTVVAIGAPDSSENGIQSGQVSVYQYDFGDWSQIGDDIDGDIAYYRTGWSVSLSSGGEILSIGEIGSTSGATDKGRVRIFKNIDSVWVQIGDSIFGDANEDYSGQGVSLSSDASTLAIGATGNDGNGDSSGQVRVYDLSALLSTNNVKLSKINLFPNPSKQQFTIQLQDGLQLKEVNIYDNLGKFVKSINTNIISTTNLSSGFYFVEIATNKGKITKKLIVE